MIIVPLSGKISKRNPPFLTIWIILVNVFVFFVLQGGDGLKYHRAIEYYFESGLAEIEIARYLDYVKTPESKGDNSDFSHQKDLNEKTIRRYYPKMMEDDTFIIKLRNDNIITPGNDIYSKWKTLRTEYERLLSRVVFIKYGFTPASINIVSLLTSMFLHGSIMHLVGNMVFLWLVGCVLELGCGRVMYLAIYLLTGICGSLLFFVVYMNSTVPCIGASGAISGLMGTYAVLYGKRKIKVFYSVGFYFNYTKISAIILLPVWVVNEFFQLFFGSFTHIAYVDHIGGLMSGAVLGYVQRRFLGTVDEKAFEDDPKEKIPGLMEEALRLVSKLDMDEARPIVEDVLKIDPDNPKALLLLFNIDKLEPQSERFHKTASRLLVHLSHKSEAELLHDIYKEYRRISEHPRFNPDLLCSISFVFSEHGFLQEAEQIMALLLRKKPEHPKVSPGILKLGRAYLKKGMPDKGKKCLQIICQKYSGSSEAEVASALLNSST